MSRPDSLDSVNNSHDEKARDAEVLVFRVFMPQVLKIRATYINFFLFMLQICHFNTHILLAGSDLKSKLFELENFKA